MRQPGGTTSGNTDRGGSDVQQRIPCGLPAVTPIYVIITCLRGLVRSHAGSAQRSVPGWAGGHAVTAGKPAAQQGPGGGHDSPPFLIPVNGRPYDTARRMTNIHYRTKSIWTLIYVDPADRQTKNLRYPALVWRSVCLLVNSGREYLSVFMDPLHTESRDCKRCS